MAIKQAVISLLETLRDKHKIDLGNTLERIESGEADLFIKQLQDAGETYHDIAEQVLVLYR